MEKIEDHKLKVPRGDRSGAVLEPYLTDQWFVDLTRETRRDGQPGQGGLAAITFVAGLGSARMLLRFASRRTD